jgi:hypothetical protein
MGDGNGPLACPFWQRLGNILADTLPRLTFLIPRHIPLLGRYHRLVPRVAAHQ